MVNLSRKQILIVVLEIAALFVFIFIYNKINFFRDHLEWTWSVFGVCLAFFIIHWFKLFKLKKKFKSKRKIKLKGQTPSAYSIPIILKCFNPRKWINRDSVTNIIIPSLLCVLSILQWQTSVLQKELSADTYRMEELKWYIEVLSEAKDMVTKNLMLKSIQKHGAKGSMAIPVVSRIANEASINGDSELSALAGVTLAIISEQIDDSLRDIVLENPPIPAWAKEQSKMASDFEKASTEKDFYDEMQSYRGQDPFLKVFIPFGVN